MHDVSERGISGSSADKLPAESLQLLRELLVGPEQEKLHDITRRLEDPQLHAEDLSEALPRAIQLRSQQDGALITVLTPVVEQSLKASVQRNPQPLVDAIFPVIGPAIRRSISDALLRMVESLNQMLEQSFSMRGWAWRMEAWRTGTSFAQVVLLRTLRYRVEQVFLIHARTGLALQHVEAMGVAAQDPGMVSGMLTAIRDFVHDSFGESRGDDLDELRVGDCEVWIEKGPAATLAAVVRGHPPQELRTLLKETIEQIHRDEIGALESFAGDASPFEIIRPNLEKLLIQARLEPAVKKKKAISPAVRLVLVLLLLGVGTWIFLRARDANRWSAAVAALRAQPGIVVISSGGGPGHRFVTGLRDPLCQKTDALIRRALVDPSAVSQQWAPFQSLDPEFVLARATRALAPPSSVRLSFQNGTLQATGIAPHEWIVTADRLAPFMPGIAEWNTSGLYEIDPMQTNLPQKGQHAP